jgi:hypothetical protein
VLELGPSQWSLVEALARRSHTRIASRVSTVWRKRSRGSSTHELASSRVTKGACAKARLWSHGDVRLTPGVKLHRVGFHEGPVDRIREVPIGIRGAASARGEFRTILCGSRPEGRGSASSSGIRAT